MGTSGAAFDVTIDLVGFDPLAATPRDPETMTLDARGTDTKHAGTAAFSDHAMRVVLADKRRAAARFLRGLRSLFATPGGDLLRAAESYGYVVEALEKLGVKPFDASVAMRFLDPGHRRGIAKGLEVVLGHEKEAHDPLRAARATIR